MITLRQTTICTAAALFLVTSYTSAQSEGLFGPSRAHQPATPSSAPSGDENLQLDTQKLEGMLGQAGVASETSSLNSLENFKMGDVEPIPTPRMIAVENETTGEMGFISSNGRYYIQGSIVDLWTGTHLETVSEVRDSRQTLDLNTLDYDDIATFTVGSGDKAVVVFTDPDCQACFNVMSEVKAITQDDSDAYTFHVIQLPGGGRKTLPAVTKFWCSTDTPETLLSASITGNTSDLVVSENCSSERMGGAFVTADMIGVDTLPMVIAPDGYLTNSITPDLKTFLENHGNQK